MTNPTPTGGGVKVASTLKRESAFFQTDGQMNIKGVIESNSLATPQDRLKEKYERIRRIKELRETGQVKDYKIEL